MTYKLNKILHTVIITAFILFINPYGHLYGQRTKSSLNAGQQRNAEKGLKDNRYFFYFINPSVSNFGDDNEKKIFKEAIQRDILAQLLYMKFLFKDAFKEIRKSQKILIDLYKKIIKRDIKITKELLNEFAPKVIRAKDYRAKRYLRLGYRDAAVSKIHKVMADNFREKLFSLRLYKYVKAIKKAKHGKRYAFYSILQIRLDPAMKKKSLSSLKFNELEKIISDIYPEKKEYLRLVHYDNYYRSPDNNSFYDKIWSNPNFHELPEFEQYMKKR